MSNLKIEEFLKFNNICQISSKDKFLSAVKGQKAVYCGFDPTSSSLHIGNYVQLIILKRLSELGLKIIVVLGGATGLIGDPSGKKSERSFQDAREIQENLKSIKKFVLKVLPDAKIINNYKFYQKFNVIEFLRTFGKYININTVLEKEFIKTRLVTGISYTEFSYIVMQAWDFYNLYHNYDCYVQVGGSDQWGNITMGIEAIAKINPTSNKAVGLTFPLLVDENNNKLGKTENNVLLFDNNKVTPYKFYQYFLSLSDETIIKLTKAISSDSYTIINNKIDQHILNPSNYFLHKYLAKNIISKVFSEKKYQKIIDNSVFLFYDFPKNQKITEKKIKNLINFIPTIFLSKFNIQVAKVLQLSLGDFYSNSKIKSLIKQQGIQINNKIIKDYNQTLQKSDFLLEKFLIIKKNKQHFLVVCQVNI